ncbi:MAG: protein-L-isoaspartate O-methyltransferase, partial [Methanomicrobium sp.]|nr:protein-L-isoaspartate O-methyltransferase [Methanomicrobium sp.]
MVKNQIESRGIKDESVLMAMMTVPRHIFVPPEMQPYAYDDRPLPIGMGATISQPYIVGLMTELLELKSGNRVLEI